MKTLHLAEGFTPPVELMTQKIAILARTGAGKTNTATVIAEEVLDAKQQVVAIDPKGDWWGLRSSADGKSAGYPITVLGGDHGDLPLEPTAGALIADVAAEGVSLVLDLSAFTGRELRQFVTDFAERFYRAKAHHVSPVLLILEEADEVVPQRVDKDNARMVGAIERIVKRGRFRGIGSLLVTQRSASVNKDVLTQTEILIVQQTTSPQDRKAIDAWVEQHPDQDKRAELMAGMAALKKGEAFVWSPTFLETFMRIRIRLRRTYDAGRDVKIGEQRAAPKVLAPVDLAALGEKMRATTDKAKASDPKVLLALNMVLKRENVRLLNELEKKTGAVAAPKTVRVLEDGQLLRAEKIIDRAVAFAGTLDTIADKMREQAKIIATEIASVRSGAAAEAPRPVGRPLDSAGKLGTQGLPSAAGPVRTGVHAAGSARAATQAHESPRASASRPPATPERANGEAGLTGTHQVILDTALFLEQVGFRTPSVPQLALTAGLSPNGGYWRQLVGRLRSLGLMSGTSLTDAGRAIASHPKGAGTAEGVQAVVRGVLPSSTHQRVFDALIAAYPRGLDAGDPCLPQGGYGRQVVGRLRSLGIAGKGWPLTAAPFLFLEDAA